MPKPKREGIITGPFLWYQIKSGCRDFFVLELINTQKLKFIWRQLKDNNKLEIKRTLILKFQHPLSTINFLENDNNSQININNNNELKKGKKGKKSQKYKHIWNKKKIYKTKPDYDHQILLRSPNYKNNFQIISQWNSFTFLLWQQKMGVNSLMPYIFITIWNLGLQERFDLKISLIGYSKQFILDCKAYFGIIHEMLFVLIPNCHISFFDSSFTHRTCDSLSFNNPEYSSLITTNVFNDKKFTNQNNNYTNNNRNSNYNNDNNNNNVNNNNNNNQTQNWGDNNKKDRVNEKIYNDQNLDYFYFNLNDTQSKSNLKNNITSKNQLNLKESSNEEFPSNINFQHLFFLKIKGWHKYYYDKDLEEIKYLNLNKNFFIQYIKSNLINNKELIQIIHLLVVHLKERDLMQNLFKLICKKYTNLLTKEFFNELIITKIFDSLSVEKFFPRELLFSIPSTTIASYDSERNHESNLNGKNYKIFDLEQNNLNKWRGLDLVEYKINKNNTKFKNIFKNKRKYINRNPNYTCNSKNKQLSQLKKKKIKQNKIIHYNTFNNSLNASFYFSSFTNHNKIYNKILRSNRNDDIIKKASQKKISGNMKKIARSNSVFINNFSTPKPIKVLNPRSITLDSVPISIFSHNNNSLDRAYISKINNQEFPFPSPLSLASSSPRSLLASSLVSSSLTKPKNQNSIDFSSKTHGSVGYNNDIEINSIFGSSSGTLSYSNFISENNSDSDFDSDSLQSFESRLVSNTSSFSGYDFSKINNIEKHKINLIQDNYPRNSINIKNQNNKLTNKATLPSIVTENMKHYSKNNNNLNNRIELCGLFNFDHLIYILQKRYQELLTKNSQQTTIENLNYHIKSYLYQQKFEIEKIFQFLKNFLLYSNNKLFTDNVYIDNNSNVGESDNEKDMEVDKKGVTKKFSSEISEHSFFRSDNEDVPDQKGNVGNFIKTDNVGVLVSGIFTDDNKIDNEVKNRKNYQNSNINNIYQKSSIINHFSNLELDRSDVHMCCCNIDHNNELVANSEPSKTLDGKINSNFSQNFENRDMPNFNRKFLQQIHKYGFYLFPFSKKWGEKSVPSLQILQNPNLLLNSFKEIQQIYQKKNTKKMKVMGNYLTDLFTELHNLENLQNYSSGVKNGSSKVRNSSCLDNYTDKKRKDQILHSIFQKFENFYSSLEELNLPFPDGFHYFFIRLGYHILPRHIFLQYIDSKIFRVDNDFVKKISKQFCNKNAKKEKKKSINGPQSIKFINHLTLMINSKKDTLQILENNINYTKFLFEYYSSRIFKVFQVEQKIITIPIKELYSFFYYPLSFSYDQLELDSHNLNQEMLQYLKSNLIIYVPLIDFNKFDRLF
ncbi:gamma-secretase-activating protein [Anaeramoeba flamelloides]|uniref:Gamma-secretase-activating protein n=1 Tax=Anaeramoeba flamelloides TaxID=1746091 RepID=A0AAV7ZKE9_9EUKA|nr:gamma-secretase-activating protein [Anaeramoeba flamelloides]